MTPEDLASLPAILVAAGVALVLALLVIAGSRRGRRGDGVDARLAAADAERDVLRANHAVEIAELENKLAEAQARIQREMDAGLRLKEAETALAAAQQRISALEGSDREAVASVRAERDAARAEAERLSRESERRLAALKESHERAVADLERQHAERIAELKRAEAAAQDALSQKNAEAETLRREVETLTARLAEVGREGAAHAAGLERLRAREADLSRTLAERDATIETLRAALASAQEREATPVDSGEIERLSEALRRSEAREASANETLSRLSYEIDGLKHRLLAAEKIERKARAQAEKTEALLELRAEKIHGLEAQLAERQNELAAALERERAAAADGGGEGDDDVRAQVAALREALAAAQAEQRALLAQAQDLRAAASAGAAAAVEDGAMAQELAAAREEIATLRAEVDRLRAARAGEFSSADPIGPGDVAALKAALRELGERFIAEAPAGDETLAAEPSLAERIRAYKAARSAGAEQPARLAAPRNAGG